jgi:hypothetical protein
MQDLLRGWNQRSFLMDTLHGLTVVRMSMTGSERIESQSGVWIETIEQWLRQEDRFKVKLGETKVHSCKKCWEDKNQPVLITLNRLHQGLHHTWLLQRQVRSLLRPSSKDTSPRTPFHRSSMKESIKDSSSSLSSKKGRTSQSTQLHTLLGWVCLESERKFKWILIFKNTCQSTSRQAPLK